MKHVERNTGSKESISPLYVSLLADTWSTLSSVCGTRGQATIYFPNGDNVNVFDAVRKFMF